MIYKLACNLTKEKISALFYTKFIPLIEEDITRKWCQKDLSLYMAF